MKQVHNTVSLPPKTDASTGRCQTDTNSVFRFAPSPNGLLHLGHAYSALVNAKMAKASGGKFLLRIEDIDVGRARQEFVDAIFEDLDWLGLSWENEVVRQSDRFVHYQEAAARLDKLGVTYPCFLTRQELATIARQTNNEKDEFGAPLYLRASRGLSGDDVDQLKRDGKPFALRLNMAKCLDLVAQKNAKSKLTFSAWDGEDGCNAITASPGQWGDEVIVRKDVPASYHLAVVVDDAMQGISHVVRGQDLYASTGLHRMLQVLLDLPEPVYHHHKLIVDENLRKLSKSEGDLSLRALREAGVDRNEICQHLEDFLASRNMSLFSWR